jgi:UDP:flavonoid glycosyltransferase YjiC (YdhE family)
VIHGVGRIEWSAAWSVADRFSHYDLAGHLAVSAPNCAAWLTGQSSYRHSQLSAGQLDLLNSLTAVGYEAVRGGFPFNGGAMTVPYRPQPLVAASVRNAAQYLAARMDRRFRVELTRHLRPMFDQTGCRLVLLCGCCGLELLAAALPLLRLRPRLEVLALALGPVGRLPPAASRLRLHVIQAEGDWISRLGFRRTYACPAATSATCASARLAPRCCGWRRPSCDDRLPPMTGSSLRLLLVAPPFSGHLNPLIAMARRLRDHGFDPRFVTGQARVGLIRSLGFAADPVLVDDPYAFERIAETPTPVRHNPVRLARQLAANLALLPAVGAELAAIVRRDRPALVLADLTAPVAGLVAEAAAIPWITTAPTPFALETRTGTPAYCGGWSPPEHVGHRLRDAGGRLATRGVKRGFERIFAPQLRELHTRVYRADGSEAAYSPQAILGLGMRELEFDRDWPAALKLIGPVTETPEPYPALPRMPGGSRILVTLGTHLHWAKRDLLRQLRPLAAAFAGRQFVVSLGQPLAPLGNEPLLAEGNVTVFGYLPYDALMPEFDAVIHHGGAGITYSAIRAGKPSLVWPQDYDEFDYAARIVAAGAGIRVRRLDSRKASTALDRVLSLDPRPLRELAAAASGYDPFAATLAAVRRCLESSDA